MTGFSIAVHLLPLSEPSQHLTIALLQTIGIFVWMRFAISLSRSGLQALAADPHRFNYIQAQTLPLFENLMVLLIIAIALYLIFISWGIDMSAWLASAGIVGIAVGFAAKDTLANLFSGVLILADSPYKIGDYIVLDSGERGAVTHIGIRSTRMLTRDDVELTIPNSIMGNAKVINESGGPHPKYRIRVPVGAAYGSDVEQVRQLLTSIAEQDSLICSDPAPRGTHFAPWGGSSLDFELLCWVDEPRAARPGRRPSADRHLQWLQPGGDRDPLQQTGSLHQRDTASGATRIISSPPTQPRETPPDLTLPHAGYQGGAEYRILNQQHSWSGQSQSMPKVILQMRASSHHHFCRPILTICQQDFISQLV